MTRGCEKNGENFNAMFTDNLLVTESKLADDQAYVTTLKKHLRAVGLTRTKARQHINNVLDALMNKEVQTNVNVIYGNKVYNKDYTDHLSLKYHLSYLLAVLLQVISTT